jgi:hypothetical protein
MSAPRWALGMQQLEPGVYVDAQKRLHLDLPALCAANGYPPTEENQNMLALAAHAKFTLAAAIDGHSIEIHDIEDDRR